jgi:hypothetical protein
MQEKAKKKQAVYYVKQWRSRHLLLLGIFPALLMQRAGRVTFTMSPDACVDPNGALNLRFPVPSHRPPFVLALRTHLVRRCAFFPKLRQQASSLTCTCCTGNYRWAKGSNAHWKSFPSSREMYDTPELRVPLPGNSVHSVYIRAKKRKSSRRCLLRLSL